MNPLLKLKQNVTQALSNKKLILGTRNNQKSRRRETANISLRILKVIVRMFSSRSRVYIARYNFAWSKSSFT